MRNYFRCLTAVLLVLFMAGTALYGNAPEEGKKKYKISFSERLRYVSWDQAVNLSEDASAVTFTRHRTSLMLQWFPNQDLEFAVKLTNEFRNYLNPKGRDFNMHEVIFDQLYIQWKNIGNLPLTLKVGRQNIILGEGFVVMDGHPMDGSRAIAFNAVRADLQLSKGHSLTAFMSYQPVTDNMLPVLNEKDQMLIEQPEFGLGLYYVGKFGKTRLDAYVIRKDVDATDDHPWEEGINTIGSRVLWPFAPQWSAAAEGAYQFGTFGDVDRAAFGGYFHLDYTLPGKKPFLKTLTLGGIYLSGDDPETPEWEGWDPVFSRWPKWSESFIYALVPEYGVAYWSNFNSIYLSGLFELMESVKLKLTWHHLGSQHAGMSGFTGGGGKTRGNLYIGRLDFRVNKYTTGHFVWEHLKPGGYYYDGKSSANWLRFELLFKI